MYITKTEILILIVLSFHMWLSSAKYRTNHRQGKTFQYISMPKYSLQHDQTSLNDSQYPPNMIKQLISNAKQWASKFWDIEESATTTLDRRKQTILSNDSNLERDTPGQVVSTAFHHLGITLGSVIDNVIEMIPEWPFQDSPTGDPFQNRNHLCRRKKNDVCLSLNGKNYGCGIPNSNGMARIVNGYPTGHNEFPWIAALHRTGPFRKNKDSIGGFCGGALVSDLYVITAGHCIARLRTTQFKVVLGQYSPDHPSGHEEEFFVSKKIVHSDFDAYNYHNDIGLVKLNRRAEFSRHIRPVCLPTIDKSFEEANATVIGWGYTKEDGNGSSPDLLHQIQIPMMRNIECIKESKYSQGELKHISILPTMLCAGNYNGTQRDACNGDSGGPLTIMTKSRQHVLIGIVSFGYGCADKNYPGVYTRVTKYIDWIRRRTRDSCFCNDHKFIDTIGP